MKSKLDIKRDKTCRICLCDSEELKSLRDKIGEEQKSILKTINFVVNIKLKLKQDLPNKICIDCVTNLELADTFKRQCLDSEEILGQYHSGSEEEDFEEVEKEGEPRKSSRKVENLLKNEDNSAEYANYSISKSKSNFHTIEPDIIKDDEIKVEIENSENDSDYDTEYLDLDAFDLDETSLKPTKSDVLDTVRDDHDIKKKTTVSLRKGKQTFTCNDCGETYIYKKALIKHITRGHGEKMFQEFECRLCKTKFDRRSKLNKHMTNVHKDISNCILCKKCGQPYKLQTCLNRHMRLVHGMLQPCKICGKKFATRKILEKHKREEHGQQVCPICGKRLLAVAMPVHILRHENIKAFQCDHCEKSFVTKTELVAHNRIHTGDRPFLCTVCGRGFTTASSMKKHRQVKHSNARPYACGYCTMAFKDSIQLKRHTLTHTGEKPYKCTVCEAAFPRSTALTMHMKKHATDTPNIEAVMAAAIRKSGRPPCLSGITSET